MAIRFRFVRRLVNSVARCTDPLRVLGSGALLVTVSASDAGGTLTALEQEGIAATDIGHIVAVSGDAPAVVHDDQRWTGTVRDGTYALWE